MWSDTMTIMLRYMVNDYITPYTYSDNILQTALLVSATFVSQELNFKVPFVVDLINFRIIPDPTENMPLPNSTPNQIVQITSALPDYNFINLVVLRTAVMIAMNEYKASTSQAFYFKEFHSSVDMRNVAPSKKTLWEDLQKLYDDKRMAYQMGIRVSAAAIVTPLNIMAGGWRGGPAYMYSERDMFIL